MHVGENKRIIIVGKAACGKNHLREKFEQRGFKYGVSYTTRKPRPGESEGYEYHFINDDEFVRMINNDEFYEHVNFNNCYYGTTKFNFNTKNIFILTPEGVSKIKPEDRKDCFIIFLDIPENIRINRMSERHDFYKIKHRLEADKKDFDGFSDYDLRITNEDF